MPDYREINAIAKDPARARRLALYLLSLEDFEWTDWERDFLEHMAIIEEQLTTRQTEILVQLRDASVRHEKIEGFVLRTLVEKCFIYRCELDEGDALFIEKLKALPDTKFRRRDASRILRCARLAGELEPHQGLMLDPSELDKVA